MSGFVYILCALTSLACSVLLMRGYIQNRIRLLFWSGLCFGCFAANNIVLYLDVHVIHQVSLMLLRDGFTLAGLLILLFGLIWDAN
ncbi:MAG TPA: DUF5985 family protein [Planctomycetota bacterium]|nr:DUF5985 family protein [Planctomycetota bacterium]